MEKKFKFLGSVFTILVLMSLIVVTACNKDDDEPNDPMLIATFQFEVNDLEVTFSNYTLHATSYSWDFGDNLGTSTEKNPIYTYTDGGKYEVTLTATGANGSDDYTKEVQVVKPGGENLILNGGFDDDSEWNIISHNASPNGFLEIANGVATFDEAIDVPSGSWGEESHMGLNQAITLEAGSYQLDLDITTNGIDELWSEVWVGTGEPIEGEDYNENNNATKVLSFNAWSCAETNAVYSGSMAAADCEGTGGSIDIVDTGLFYVVIRTGGFTFGEGGVIVDNVTMVKIN